jgi:hypothetical protein
MAMNEPMQPSHFPIERGHELACTHEEYFTYFFNVKNYDRDYGTVF